MAASCSAGYGAFLEETPSVEVPGRDALVNTPGGLGFCGWRFRGTDGDGESFVFDVDGGAGGVARPPRLLLTPRGGL